MAQAAKQNQELFERTPVPRALFSLAVPTIISQLVVMIYNMADTFFIGRTNDPYKVAAASMAYVLFFMLNALANLFGIGGGSLISRLLGEGRQKAAGGACALSIWGAVVLTGLYSLICLIFMEPILRFTGASDHTIGYASRYVLWVVVLGGIPASLSMTMSHVFRSEGHGKAAGFGLTMGGILNIILDPIFMFVLFPDGQEVTGAAAATCVCNLASLAYYIVMKKRLGTGSVLSFDIRRVREGFASAREIFGVGIPSAVSTIFVCAAIMVLNGLASGYGDIPVAAIGIVKKLDMLPHNVGTGLCQGMIPLVAYNYAAGNYPRMKQAIRLTRWLGVGFTGVCILTFVTLARPLAALFIQEPETLGKTASFLKIMVLATPLTVSNFHMTYTLQAMGKGRASLVLSCCRQGVVLIPLLVLMDRVFGLYGLVWSQLIADAITLVVALALFRATLRRLPPRPGA